MFGTGLWTPDGRFLPDGSAEVDWGNPMTQGLVLWCPRADGSWANVATPNSGTRGTAATPAPGNNGGIGCNFDGTQNAYVTFGSAGVFNIQQFTMSAWVYLRSYFSGSQRIFDDTAALAGNPCMFLGSTGKIGVQKEDITGSAVGVTAVPLNLWTHVAATYDGATVCAYINGVLDNSAAFSVTFNAWSLRIGTYADGSSATNRFNGIIDNPKIWNRRLVAGDVLEDAQRPYGMLAQSAVRRFYSIAPAPPPTTTALDMVYVGRRRDRVRARSGIVYVGR